MYVWKHLSSISKYQLFNSVLPTVVKIFKFFLMFIYFWRRERYRQSMSGGGAEREGDAESKVGSRLWAVSTEPDEGLEPTSHEFMTQAEVGRSINWATQAPHSQNILVRSLDLISPIVESLYPFTSLSLFPSSLGPSNHRNRE